MFYLLQLFNLMNEDDKKEFYTLLKFDCDDQYEEAIELGYSPSESFTQTLLDRFNLDIELTEKQAEYLDTLLLKSDKIESAYRTSLMLNQ